MHASRLSLALLALPFTVFIFWRLTTDRGYKVALCVQVTHYTIHNKQRIGTFGQACIAFALLLCCICLILSSSLINVIKKSEV